MTDQPRIAIIGAGMAGLALANGLASRGFAVRVHEQAHQFARVGSGIQQSANAVKVLEGLGLSDRLRRCGFVPSAFIHRVHDTAEVTNRIPLGERAEEAYGAPYLLLHRGDLHDALLSGLPDPQIVTLGRKLMGIEHLGECLVLTFADGSREEADVVIGADGIHSAVRDHVFGHLELRFAGNVGYRAILPRHAVDSLNLDDNTKWWGPDRHLVTYFITAARDELYAMGTVPEPDFDLESWSARGDVGHFRESFASFHETVRSILGAVTHTNKWALADHLPLDAWSDGNIAVLGDAAHPMMPHMGQGAAMAMEDVAVLLRSIDESTGGTWAPAFARFEATRKTRTSEMQALSAGNSFARTGKDAIDWVYGYDAWTAPLAPATT